MNPFLNKLREERAALAKTIEETLNTAQTENREALTEAEDKNIEDAAAKIKDLDARIEHLSDIELRNAEAAKLAKRVDDANKENGSDINAHPAKVKREERTYRPDGEFSFLSDAYQQAMFGDVNASERIVRHQNEERIEKRDVGTAQFTGLVVPQYLTSEFEPLARAGRPVANACAKAPLTPVGMTESFARVTTGTAVATQTTQNTGVQETNMDDTLITRSKVTIAGQQNVSRQALEFGVGVEAQVFGDLLGAYHTELDRQVIAGVEGSGELDGILTASGTISVSYSDSGSPSVDELWPKLANAIGRVNNERYLPATFIAMTPLRWAWFTAAVDSDKRPLFGVNGQNNFNAAAVGDAAKYGQVVGTILGLPVVTDANIPANVGYLSSEDKIIVARASDLVLKESSALQLRMEQTTGGSLTVKLVVYGYSAFTAARSPKSTAIISGSGLQSPIF